VQAHFVVHRIRRHNFLVSCTTTLRPNPKPRKSSRFSPYSRRSRSAGLRTPRPPRFSTCV
jgi:hypothetical protein